MKHFDGTAAGVTARAFSAGPRLLGFAFLAWMSYPNYLSPSLTKAQKSRARREPSGVFTQFQAAQIQQFKEAFQLIDHDKDGWVNKSDLVEIFGSLGSLSFCYMNLIYLFTPFT